MLIRAATVVQVVQVLQDLFYVLLHVLFYLWSLLNINTSQRRLLKQYSHVNISSACSYRKTVDWISILRQWFTWLWYSMPMLSVLTRMAKRIPRWKYSLSTSFFSFSRMPHTHPANSRCERINRVKPRCRPPLLKSLIFCKQLGITAISGNQHPNRFNKFMTWQQQTPYHFLGRYCAGALGYLDITNIGLPSHKPDFKLLLPSAEPAFTFPCFIRVLQCYCDSISCCCNNISLESTLIEFIVR